jgi:outer membrane protein OmpU
MRSRLLGTTALAAIGLLAPAAYADDGVTLHIGGRYLGAAGVVLDEDQTTFNSPLFDTRDYVFKQDVEVYFLGETTLANGLTVGARIELEGQTSGDQIDAVYAYFSGGFGEVRFGDTYEALAQLCYTVPSASTIFGADSPFFNFSNSGLRGYAGTNGTCYGIDNKSTKVVYFSPQFDGFQFAASFTPDNTEDTRNTLNGAGTRTNNDAGQLSENFSAAATYEHDFNGIALALGGGFSEAFNRENPSPFEANNRREYNAYARLGYAGFTVGGAYSKRDNVAEFGDFDDQVYGVGVTYDWSRYSVGLGWTHGDYETFGHRHDNYSVVALTGALTLAPGISIDALLGYDNYDSRIDSRDYKAVEVGLGTAISF